MGKVGRPSNHIPIKFVEYKKEDGTVETYVLVGKKLVHLTTENLNQLLSENNIPNPLEAAKSQEEEEQKKEEPAPPAALPTENLSIQQTEIVIPNNSEDDNSNEIQYEPTESYKQNFENDSLNDSFFFHDFIGKDTNDETSTEEPSYENLEYPTKRNDGQISDLFESNEKFNPFQIYF